MSEVERLLQFLYLAPVGIIETDAVGNIQRLNPLANQTLLLIGGSTRMMNVFDALEDVHPGLRSRVKAYKGLGMIIDHEQLTLYPDVSKKECVMSLTAHRVSSDCLAFVMNDVTQLVQQEREIRRREMQLRAIVDSVRAHIIVPLDENGVVQEHNESIRRLTDFGEELVGQPVDTLFEEDINLQSLLSNTHKTGWVELSESMRHKTGPSWWGSSVITRMVDDADNTIGYSLITREETERHKREQQLADWASHDALTGATNRRAFGALADVELTRAQRLKHPLSFMLLDIDNFKRVNDNHGHDAGDAVLRELSQRLALCVRRPDYLVRLGGEEFGLLLPNTDTDGAYTAAERVRRMVEETPFQIESGTLPITVSVGVVSRPDNELDFEPLFKAADIALYRAKQNGRNQVQIAQTKDYQTHSV